MFVVSWQRADHRALDHSPAAAWRGGRPGRSCWPSPLWLWATLLFANFAESLADGAWQGAGRPHCVPPSRREWWRAPLSSGRTDQPVCIGCFQRRYGGAAMSCGSRLADTIPGGWRGDHAGTRIRGRERHHPAKSAPVIREAGGDRSAAAAARSCSRTSCTSVSVNPRRGLSRSHDRDGENAKRSRTPNEIAPRFCSRG